MLIKQKATHIDHRRGETGGANITCSIDVPSSWREKWGGRRGQVFGGILCTFLNLKSSFVIRKKKKIDSINKKFWVLVILIWFSLKLS